MTLPARLVLLGSPVAHSLSPLFQNAALESAGLPLRYEAIDVAAAALPPLLEQLARVGAAGNATVPHKEAVFARCAVRTALAERVGAVNCFWSVDGRLHGDNTDVGGFREAVRALGGDATPASLALLGAGGAAAAACVAADEWGACEVRVTARNIERAQRLAERFPRVTRAYPDLESALDGVDLVVNATPLGLRDGDPVPVAPELLPRDALVLDMVYRQRGTRWTRAARQAGHRASDGLTMLVAQGVLSFERWFGFAPDREAISRALRDHIGRDA